MLSTGWPGAGGHVLVWGKWVGSACLALNCGTRKATAVSFPFGAQRPSGIISGGPNLSALDLVSSSSQGRQSLPAASPKGLETVGGCA